MKIQIAVPFVLMVMSFFIVKFITYQPVLTNGEMSMVAFVAEKIDTLEKLPFTVYSDIKSPFDIGKVTPEGYPSIPLQTLAPQESAETGLAHELKISMIVISEVRRMAIINGEVVKEGDGIGSTRIKKIEKSRILVEEISPPSIHEKGREKRWLYLKEEND